MGLFHSAPEGFVDVLDPLCWYEREAHAQRHDGTYVEGKINILPPKIVVVRTVIRA